ncbi:hypothetical protein AVEN_104788-1 [Araneus ventricosus]|uniref:Uncharacterized protein n=1 Tax=Araneus ventricosus TaxID=182803 RepID=A0A4Y2TTR9_ARAVE|nr:hypothetical protein AVEN_104788-1 [Araneus ventricosus]
MVQISINYKEYSTALYVEMVTIRTYSWYQTRNKEDIRIQNSLLEEMTEELQEQRELFRKDAKKNIDSIQYENRKTCNKKRKKASEYKKGDLIAIQRIHFSVGLKLRTKFLVPYKVTKVNSRDRYEVEKVGHHEGPNVTTTSPDLMKSFSTN